MYEGAASGVKIRGFSLVSPNFATQFVAVKKRVLPVLCLFLLLFANNSFVQAQCSGNRLFFEDFGGSSSTPLTSSPLPSTVTSYTFDSLGTISDGEYGIRKTTADIQTGQSQYGSWHVGYDHSGTGNMMLVNADYTAGKFYETRVSNLCAGSLLYFSAWIANLLRSSSTNPLDPDLKFQISSATTGNQLATFTTGTIPRYASFTWTKYGFNFALPPGESDIILRIFNNQAGGLGNDLCLDDIEFSLCGPAMTPQITGSYLNSGETCTGSSVSFSGNVASGFYQNPAYQWQFSTDGTNWNHITGAQAQQFTITGTQVSHSGFYRLLVAEAANINAVNCRSVSPLLELKVFAPPVISINGPLTICEKDTIKLSSSIAAFEYKWTYPGGTGNKYDLTIPNALVNLAGSISLTTTTHGGCISTTTTVLNIKPNLLTRAVPVGDTVLCNGASLVINANIPPATSFLWNDGTTNFTRTINTAGNYSLQVSDGICSRTDSFSVQTKSTPVVRLRNDTTICYSDSLLIDATTPQTDIYLWNTGSTKPKLIATEAGTYTVTVENYCGQTTDQVILSLIECGNEVFIPNAFTPNGDRLNDILKGRAYFRLDDYELSIYNRWGELVFKSKVMTQGWDGQFRNQPSPAGIYTWKISYKRNDKQFTKTGTVLLIR